MRIIELDASRWKTPKDFFGAFRIALGTPSGHGWGINAFVDSMVYGGMNSVEPPYTVQILEAASAPKEVQDQIALLAADLVAARRWHNNLHGSDIDVSIVLHERSN